MEVTGVFEGGGVRGIALAGAAAAALDQGVAFRHTIGTSAGSMVAALVAAGYQGDELRRAVCSIDWPGLLDPVPGYRIPVVGRHLALIRWKGWFHGDALEITMRRLLAAKGMRAFGDLPPDSLRIVVTDLNHSTGVVLPGGLAGYGIDPDSFSIATAVRMSSAIPFMFRPVPLRDRLTDEKVLFADGAMAANFPIGLAEGHLPTLGFVLANDHSDHPHVHVAGPASLARSVLLAGIRSRYSLPRPTDARIVQVPVDGDLDFDLEPKQARAVFDRGRAAVAAQLAGHPVTTRFVPS